MKICSSYKGFKTSTESQTKTRVNQFYQKAWLKQYIDKNANLRKDAKNDFEKDLFEVNESYRDIKLVVTDKKKKAISFRAQLLYI